MIDTPDDGQTADMDVIRLLQQALSEHQQGRPESAKRFYQLILEKFPGQSDALHYLGVLYHQGGRTEDALGLLQQARDAAPHNPDILCNLGLLLNASGKPEEAVEVLGAALEVEPDLPALHNNLGNARLAIGDLTAAIESYRQAIRLDGGHVEAMVNLANAYMLAGRPDRGCAHCEAAIRLQPTFAQAHSMLGNLLASMDQLPAAIESHEKARQLAPDDASLICSLASCLERDRNWDEALGYFDAALAIDPACGPAISGALLLRRSTCHWSDLEASSRRFADGVRRGQSGLTPFIYLSEPSTAMEQLACSRLWSDDKARKMMPLRKQLAFAHAREPVEKITIAYFSHDFRRHPTAYTKVGLFENHDRSRYRVLGYCNGPDDDSDIRKRVIAAFDTFRDVRGWPPTEVAKRIHADGVDILVDLKGHTLNAPTETFALRPAPIQVNYKGYPGTMGADFIDYIVADDFVVPEDDRASCSEKVVYLPETYWVDDRNRAMPATPRSRQELGLPQTGTVFCCFNSSYKLSPELFAVWMEILESVADSVLWVQNSNPRCSLADNLRREAAGRGIAAERICFAPRLPLKEYLALFRVADLFLDARPYNAHTTASDALWCGLPVLTCPGNTFSARVAGSMLRTIGLPELIAENLEDYRDTAIRLARYRDELARIRERLEMNRLTTPLYDTARLTRHMEAAYETMYQRWIDGRGPAHFSVPAIGDN
jgi:predicted O-linked N-acetylglucosamine transferase (SPINDLY family)